MFKKNNLILLALNMTGMLYASSETVDKTALIHAEMANLQNPNLTEQTHPFTYNMVKQLAVKANVKMPEYITIYSAQYNVVGDYGVVYTAVRDLNAYVDMLGDIYICREVLTCLNYEQIQGTVALALAQKVVDKPSKLAVTGLTTLGVTLGSVYALNKRYNLKLGTAFKELMFGDNYYMSSDDRAKALKGIFTILIFPAIVATKIHANYLQKTVDLHAADFTDNQNIIHSIIAIEQLTNSYAKEDFFSRLVTKLNLEKTYNTVFYPIRGFNNTERINYLDKSNK